MSHDFWVEGLEAEGGLHEGGSWSLELLLLGRGRCCCEVVLEEFDRRGECVVCSGLSRAWAIDIALGGLRRSELS